VSVFFATPAYRSDPNVALAWASRTSHALGLSGTKAGVLYGCAWLHLGYATLVADFLASGCDALFMRDDDVFPDVTTVGRMLGAVDDGAPAIVAPYKVRDEDRFDVVLEPDGSFRWAGVGCMVVHRRVLEQLWSEHAAELGFRTGEGRELVAIFRDFLASRDDGVQLVHEDHAFWYRVRAAGFAVEVLDDVEVLHAGASLHYRKPSP
jgi:hypothetical protein